MAWQVHSWDAAARRGEVVSSHFGPWPFDGAAAGHDFVVGEEVLVELVGAPSSYRVQNVRAARQRQPDGTRAQVFDELNAKRFESCYVEERIDSSIKLWFGDCCHMCGPSWFITFRDVTMVKGLSEHGDVDAPLFRLASPQERREHELEGTEAYCIVTQYGYGPDGPPVFIVAGSVDIEPFEAK